MASFCNNSRKLALKVGTYPLEFGPVPRKGQMGRSDIVAGLTSTNCSRTLSKLVFRIVRNKAKLESHDIFHEINKQYRAFFLTSDFPLGGLLQPARVSFWENPNKSYVYIVEFVPCKQCRTPFQRNVSTR